MGAAKSGLIRRATTSLTDKIEQRRASSPEASATPEPAAVAGTPSPEEKRRTKGAKANSILSPATDGRGGRGLG